MGYFLVKSRVFNAFIFSIFFSINIFANTKPIQFRKAQAIRPAVEIYQESNFDSEILTFINPGRFYLISNKLYGPFYKIKISSKVIGYVADSEIDIEGIGPLKEKPFINEEPKVTNEPDILAAENDESEDPEAKQTYNQIVLQLVNYHEKTMNQNQVADLWSIGYRHIPFLSDFSASVSWDINLSIGLPKYYKEKLAVTGQGGTLWTGAQLVNISPFGSSKTIRYGLGPFLKYSNYSLESVNQKYSLQDLNMGFLFEGGFIYHVGSTGFDIGLRYYWEKSTYGGISLGILF